VEYLLHRITAFAIAPSAFPTWGGGEHAAGRGVRNGALWLLLLILPGSFLVLPLAIWWKVRRDRMAAARRHAAFAGTRGERSP